MTNKKSALDVLFGSGVRVRLMRFFYVNPRAMFTMEELVHRTGARRTEVVRELKILDRAGFVKRAVTMRTEEVKEMPKKKISKRSRKGRVVSPKPKHVRGWTLDRTFAFIEEMSRLFTSVVPELRRRLAKSLRDIGKVKMVVASGVFVGDDAGVADLLVVGDDIKKRKVEDVLSRFEHELGKDLVYAVISSEEFEYRVGMQDRFVQEIFARPHEVVFDQRPKDAVPTPSL